MGRTFDPITLEILWRRLISIVDEADSSVARTAFSSLSMIFLASLLWPTHDFPPLSTVSVTNDPHPYFALTTCV